MRKFYCRLLILLILLIAIDQFIGVSMKYLSRNANVGSTQKREYIINKATEDILIMGSSRAVHHYDPSILEEQLGCSVYNSGYEGCGILLAYSLYSLLSERYTPKYIIYEVTPGYDYLKEENNNLQYLREVKEYYDTPIIKNLFKSIDKTEGIKMESYMYRYNTTFFGIILDYVGLRSIYEKGYDPLFGSLKYEPEVLNEQTIDQTDSLKEECLHQFIEACIKNGTSLIFTISPYYKKTNDTQFDYIKKIAHQYNIPLISHYCDSLINQKRDYFKNANHLNIMGVTEYNKLVAKEIKEIINTKLDVGETLLSKSSK